MFMYSARLFINVEEKVIEIVIPPTAMQICEIDEKITKAHQTCSF